MANLQLPLNQNHESKLEALFTIIFQLCTKQPFLSDLVLMVIEMGQFFSEMFCNSVRRIFLGH